MIYPYSPEKVNAVWRGIAFTDFAEDSMIRVKRNEDLVTEVVGARGELSLTINANKTGEIEIEFLQTSATNRRLAILLSLQEISGIINVGNLIIQEPSGASLWFAQNAYLKKSADADLGKEQNSRVWTWGCERLTPTGTPDGFSIDVTGLTTG